MSGRIILIAGPHDAEDSTFINADLIALGLSPFAPERASIHAARLMLTLVAEHVERGASFALETTLAGRGYSRGIPHWRTRGYRVTIVFLELPDVETAIARVAERVRQGGHNIPEDIIRRRFHSGRRHFHELYKPLVNSWLHFDNAGKIPVLVDWNER